MSGPITMESLFDLPRWVAWQPEERDGRTTKVPYSPHGGRARSNDPATWGTAQEARACAERLRGGGAGFELGDLGNGIALGGLDLDTCRDAETGAIEPWAAELIRRFGSYCEVSPSGTGAKLFFHFDPAALPGLLRVMGSNGGKKWARGKGVHAPAIEVYLTGRYFAYTGERLPDSPIDVRPVSRATLERLIQHDGPAFAGTTPAATPVLAQGSDGEVLARARLVPAAARLLRGDRTGLADTTRSGLAMALGGALKRAGWSFDDATDALHAWPETADWCAEKGDANGGRELRRLWERAGTPEPRQHGEEFTPYTDAPRPGGRLRLLSPADCEAAPGREYLIKSLIARGDVGCIFGAPGAGKSVVAPHLGYAVAQGRAVFGRRTKLGAVFYVPAEDQAGMRQRVRALRLCQGNAPGFSVVEGAGNLLDDEQANELRALVAEHRPALVVIDTLAVAFSGIDENSSADMGRVVACARRLADLGAAVLLVHHDVKNGGNTPRGHSVLHGALDMAVHLSPAGDGGIVRGKLVKNRNGPCDLDLAFRIEATTLGTDADGDAITAPVAREVSGAAVAKPERLPRAARATLDVLRDLALRSPSGRVPETAWRDACCDGFLVSASENREARCRAFRRAEADLIAQRVVEAHGGEVWLPRMGGDEFDSDDSDGGAIVASAAPVGAPAVNTWATSPRVGRDEQPGQIGQNRTMSDLSGRQNTGDDRTKRTRVLDRVRCPAPAMPNPGVCQSGVSGKDTPRFTPPLGNISPAEFAGMLS